MPFNCHARHDCHAGARDPQLPTTASALAMPIAVSTIHQENFTITGYNLSLHFQLATAKSGYYGLMQGSTRG
jgi:hypothetical protein